MNKRIKELADEAAKFSAIMALPTGEAGDNLFVEKFAELIVRECCDIADEVERADTGMFASKYIRAHFGIEE